MKNVNPEKDFKETPEKFSEESRIIKLKKQEYRSGIIINSIDEFANAIRVYDNGCVAGSNASRDGSLKAIGEDHGGMAVGFALLAGAQEGEGFAEKLIQRGVKALKEREHFYEDNDYALGTRFSKTSVTCSKAGDKYVLEICAAYVGDKPEENLAEAIGKKRALTRSTVDALLKPVDNWWFNINLEDMLKELNLPKEKIEMAAKDIATGGYSNPEIKFKHNDKEFSLRMSIDGESRHLEPEEGDYHSRYLQARGTSVVGGAWSTWKEDGNTQCTPRSVNPVLTFSVAALEEDGYDKRKHIDDTEIREVLRAREYIAEILAK